MLPCTHVNSSWKWYDLGRGVAHLGLDVAQLSQVLSFLADVIVSLVAEVLC